MEKLDGKRPQPLSKSSIVLVLYAAAGALGLLISWVRGDSSIYLTEHHTSALHLLTGPALGVTLGLLFVLFTRLTTHRFDWAKELHCEFRNLVGDLSHSEILVLAVASSFGEELLFRGALQPWVGLWPQAVLFAALHIGPDKRFLPWTILAFLFGALFGALFNLTGNLGGAIAAHFTINYLNLHFISRVRISAPSRLPEKTFQTR